MFRIDTHLHIIPQPYLDMLAKFGVTAAGGMQFPKWDEQGMLEVMDTFQIKTAITSISSPGVYFGDTALAVTLARICNDFSAELMAKHPKRLGAFATLPLPDIEQSLKEIDYAFDTLKLDGVVLLSNYKEHYLGHPDFQPVFDALNKRRAVVFIHPTDPIGYQNSVIPLPAWMVEFPCDTTRAVADLLYSGRLHQCPDITFILSHAGGATPYLAGRMALFDLVNPAIKDKVPDGPITHLKRLYFDTALSTSTTTLNCLLDFVPAEHILFGSDFPFMPLPGIKQETLELDAYLKSRDDLHAQINYKNALSLFPRLRE